MLRVLRNPLSFHEKLRYPNSHLKLHLFQEFISYICFSLSRHALDLAHIPLHAAESLHDISQIISALKAKEVTLLSFEFKTIYKT
jgi:hypothetical protein